MRYRININIVFLINAFFNSVCSYASDFSLCIASADYKILNANKPSVFYGSRQVSNLKEEFFFI